MPVHVDIGTSSNSYPVAGMVLVLVSKNGRAIKELGFGLVGLQKEEGHEQ
jgi:hypothetical protein